MSLSKWLILFAFPVVLAACGEDPSDGPDAGAPLDGGSGDAGQPLEGATTEVLIDRQATQLTSGFSPELSVVVPEGVVAMTITVEGLTTENYAVDGWTDPSGLALVNAQWAKTEPGLCMSCANRIAASEGVFAAIAPNNPAASVTAGTHTFKAYGYSQSGIFAPPKPSNAEVLVSVHVKRASQPLTTGVVDFNLFFTGARNWTAATAPTDVDFQAALTAVRATYTAVGLAVGELTYQDIDERFKVIESVQGADSDLMELFAQSALQPRAAVNLFFVEELRSNAFGGAGVILGISGGIPGPPLRQGTVKSGVAIVCTPPAQTGAAVDLVVAHETGHFLGLFHTSEQNFMPGVIPQAHDPLPDTPENDDSYLMFNTGKGHTLSPWQGRVMLQNPWIRHPEAI